MTHRVVTAKFHGSDEVLGLWKMVYNKLSRKKDKRNNLAHATLVTFQMKEHGKPLKVQSYLCPFYMAWIRRPRLDEIGKPPKNALTAAEIGEIEGGFKRADVAMRKAYEAMRHALHSSKFG